MQKPRTVRILLLAIIAATAAQVVTAQVVTDQGVSSKGKPAESSRQRIVFVCEHGAALSVVSAAYFNKLARKQHLPFEAIARGTNPQEEIAVSARDGLKADGVPLTTRRPQALSIEDAAHARRIIAFCPLPARYSRVAPVESWSDVPPTGSNYALARDAILRYLQELMRRLKAADGN
jgi:arsenate reductase (thioredoxin)